MPVTPTQRTLAHLRKSGFIAEITERWCPFSKRRKDLLGFVDVLALRDGAMVAVQTTSGSNLAARRTKILAEPRALQWLRSGGRIEIHGWAKRGPRGKRKTWTLRMETVSESDFTAAVAAESEER